VSVDSGSSPPRLESRGLVDGHVAFGVRDERHVFHAKLFDGSSSGSIAEIVVWKLFRAELGVAGASIGIGPVDLALGVLFYDPEIPDFESAKQVDAAPPAPVPAQDSPPPGS
jgi:hypothetical protein